MTVETIVMNDVYATNGSLDIHVWQDDDGDWYSCRSGIFDGTYSESEDAGPFQSRQEAIDWQCDHSFVG